MDLPDFRIERIEPAPDAVAYQVVELSPAGATRLSAFATQDDAQEAVRALRQLASGERAARVVGPANER